MSPLGIQVGGVRVCVILVLQVIFKIYLLCILLLFIFLFWIEAKNTNNDFIKKYLNATNIWVYFYMRIFALLFVCLSDLHIVFCVLFWVFSPKQPVVLLLDDFFFHLCLPFSVLEKGYMLRLYHLEAWNHLLALVFSKGPRSVIGKESPMCIWMSLHMSE